MDNRNRMFVIAVVALLCFALGYVIGFEHGASYTIKKVVDIAQRFVSIDVAKVRLALDYYSNDIKNFFPMNYTNASVFNDTRN